jgi:hypothetical protein
MKVSCILLHSRTIFFKFDGENIYKEEKYSNALNSYDSLLTRSFEFDKDGNLVVILAKFLEGVVNWQWIATTDETIH